MLEGAEVLIDLPMVRKGQRMLQALADTLPPDSVVSKRYAGQHRVLVLYGIGDRERQRIAHFHRSKGGRIVMWDLGYFGRDDGAMRLSIDSLHPTAEQLARSPAAGRRTFNLREDANPAGPVLLVGLGDKSLNLYGLRPMQWERTALQAIRTAFPERRVVYRPKGKAQRHLAGVTVETGNSIEEALVGCSLVVCRHSNVAVDACVAGVPVRCDDGAAMALYGRGSQPAPAERLDFLHRLTWWNWSPDEASQAWRFIEGNI